jgi:hypothetical protein
MAKADGKFQVRAPEWWKHLRPSNKRTFWIKVRKKAKQLIRQEARDDRP